MEVAVVVADRRHASAHYRDFRLANWVVGLGICDGSAQSKLLWRTRLLCIDPPADGPCCARCADVDPSEETQCRYAEGQVHELLYQAVRFIRGEFREYVPPDHLSEQQEKSPQGQAGDPGDFSDCLEYSKLHGFQSKAERTFYFTRACSWPEADRPRDGSLSLPVD